MKLFFVRSHLKINKE